MILKLILLLISLTKIFIKDFFYIFKKNFLLNFFIKLKILVLNNLFIYIK